MRKYFAGVTSPLILDCLLRHFRYDVFGTFVNDTFRTQQ